MLERHRRIGSQGKTGENRYANSPLIFSKVFTRHQKGRCAGGERGRGTGRRLGAERIQLEQINDVCSFLFSFLFLSVRSLRQSQCHRMALEKVGGSDCTPIK